MPAMITHYLIARHVLHRADMPSVKRPDAFLIGAQGPDLLYFHRVYPWQPGIPSFQKGNAIHIMNPTRLIRILRHVLQYTPMCDRPIAESYILGFLCHYAADRVIHPFVCNRQQDLRKRDPAYAKFHNPYHYRVESALDVELLKAYTGRSIKGFSLCSIMPPADHERDRVIADIWHSLLFLTLGKTISKKSLQYLTEDFRQTLYYMNDPNGIKRRLFVAGELLCRTALLSSLIRSNRPDGYDYINRGHHTWKRSDNTESTDDFFALCQQAETLSAEIAAGFLGDVDEQYITNGLDFSGRLFEIAHT
ncbi:MAG: zinc dependent phospholipase C family protein [Clostridia bacterium]|nr:zinc dependent phospholipase C family protein [Clostridia bacterium]